MTTPTPETLDERHARLCARPDMDPHEPGCEDPACVDRCRRGHCHCAGCEAHEDDAVARGEAVRA